MRKLLMAVFVVALAGLAGCGDDDGNGEGAAVDREPREDPERYCELAHELDSGDGPDVDFATASDEEISAAFQEFFSRDDIRDRLDELERAAPRTIQADVVTIVSLAREVGRTGDPSVFESDEYLEAQAATLEWESEHCEIDPGS